MASPRRRNDRSEPRAAGEERGPRPARHGPRRAPVEEGWLWGVHAVEAAVANPARRLLRLVASPDRARTLGERLAGRGEDAGVRLEVIEPAEIARLLPAGAAHQGLALRAEPLEELGVDDVADPAHGLILVLDQVTDPQNVGAVLRSAAAFGARGVVLQDRHSPALTGALAKAAAGAVDRLPVARIVNLSRALEQIAEAGWRTVGLAGEAQTSLEEAAAGGPVCLVLGSEGEGLRRLVAEHCDVLASIPMPGGFESLNVSAAAAVALYEATRPRRAHP